MIKDLTVPQHDELYPEAEYSKDGELTQIRVTINEKQINLTLEPTVQLLISPHLKTVFRNENSGGRLIIGQTPNSCHYHHKSKEIYAAISNCDGNLVSLYFFTLYYFTN